MSGDPLRSGSRFIPLARGMATAADGGTHEIAAGTMAGRLKYRGKEARI
jgi:hypothetical protein